MATASSRRPILVHLDDEDQASGVEKTTTEQCQQIKFTFNKYEIFKTTMGSWYFNLPRKRKVKLLKQHIIKKAKEEAEKLKLNYPTLNPNWLRELNEEHGVDFYEPSPEEKHRRKQCRKLRKKLMNPSVLDEPMTVEEIEQLLRLTIGSVSSDKVTQVMNRIQTEEKLPLEKPSLYTPSSKNQFHGMKCIDLLNEPPPKQWMDSYRKGKILPRTMKSQYLSDKRAVVVYYDYDIPGTESPNGYEPVIHDSNNVC